MRPAPVLGPRELGRATLARQLLLRRHRRSPRSTIDLLVGMQSQMPTSPYLGLWDRLEHFAPEQLERLITSRKVTRLTLMRGTVHLVTSPDCFTLRSIVQPVVDRALRGNAGRVRDLAGVDIDAVAAAAGELVGDGPLTVGQLGALLAERFPGPLPESLVFAARALLPLVQVPPRGLWQTSGAVRLTTAEAWLGPPASLQTIDDVVQRYLRAYGPASPADAQSWSGLTRLAEVFERLRPELKVFRSESGRELFDLPHAPRPDPDTPAPVRFLPQFDNLTLSHADRSRVMAPHHNQMVLTSNGLKPIFLVDGMAAGTWAIERARGRATIIATPFEPLAVGDRPEVEAEAAAVLSFLAPDDDHDVRITAPR